MTITINSLIEIVAEAVVGTAILTFVACHFWFVARRRREDDASGHMVLRGKAARDFIAEMNRQRSPEEIAKHRAFLEECKAIYRGSKTGKAE